MDKMKIEIWADIACPYCFIGKKKLETALQNFPHTNQIELVWHSYELNPSLKKGPSSTSYLDYYRDKGTMLEELIQLANEVGITFNFEDVIITSTADALRTIKFARQYERSEATLEAFFMAYFTQGKCISDRTVIKEVALAVGLPTDKLEQMLDSKMYTDELTEDIRYSEDVLKLEYIPFYLFNNQTIIQGSIPYETYLQTLNRSFNDWLSHGASTHIGENITGKGCSIDGTGCH